MGTIRPMSFNQAVAASTTLDYRVAALSGDYDGQPCTDLSNAVYLRITTPLGSYWADPTFGSKMYTLQREKSVSRVRLLAEQYARDALQPLLDDGRADRIDIETTDPTTDGLNSAGGRMNMLCNVYQAGRRVASFSRPVKVMQA